MAYLDARPQQNRTAIIGIVAVIHALAGYAIVTGLATKYTREVMTILEARNIPQEVPPPPPVPDLPKTKPTPDKTKIDQPVRMIDLPVDTGYTPPVDIPPTDTDRINFQPPDPPPLAPQPKFQPQSAKPSNTPANWATTNDYPSRDLREGNQGVTGFSLKVGTNGRVLDCTITQSSGFAGLDKATCDKVSQRAKFKPAMDGNGQPTTGEYASKIRWVIPE